MDILRPLVSIEYSGIKAVDDEVLKMCMLYVQCNQGHVGKKSTGIANVGETVAHSRNKHKCRRNGSPFLK